jgi:ABC-type sugar transport system permease subunit
VRKWWPRRPLPHSPRNGGCSPSSCCSSSSGTWVFTQITLLQDGGGVANETNLLGTYVDHLGTGKGDFGTASAVSILILALTIALCWYYVRSLTKEGS